MNNLKNKDVVIIGGASGIGLTLAQKLSRSCKTITITSRSLEKAQEAAQSLTVEGCELIPSAVEASSDQQVQAFFESLPEFDHLVSMAGGAMGGGFADTDFQTIKQSFEEKYENNLRIARAAATKIKKGGSMVFTSGSGGRPHNASGAFLGNQAIRTLVEGLAVELAPDTRVNSVAPTWMKTPLWKDMSADELGATEADFSKRIPLGRTGTMEEVAEAYLFLMQNSFVTGQTLQIDGGLTLV
ncbi:SDR family oxidoreductase [Pelagicoccus albus]|uniref:SDR family oxidoreductase n=1 Tax=Pelagicoccus albus TaxID=415222 RepID=A0A7X1E9H3_9BACT|nr:SDR family oxidoreductase [Pelagicoccus albus]MBC2607865.1 SDR family oxidoreductase [Pelagicoccus albus]